MGNHRTLPYTGLHFSKKTPANGIGSTVLTVIASFAAAVLLLALAYLAVIATGLPVRVSEDGVPLHVTLLSTISSSWL